MVRKLRLFLLIAFINIAFAFVLMIIFSPYGRKEGFEYPVIAQSIVINAPVDSVFDYLGQASNAHHWSVYVDHITALNKELVTEGHEGSRRRCFKNKDEKGKQWDETTLINEKNKRRRLSIYNAQGFPFMVEDLNTEQLYTPLGAGRCRLTFALGFYDKPVSMLDRIKLYFASYFIANIFKQNIENIKRLNEKQ